MIKAYDDKAVSRITDIYTQIQDQPAWRSQADREMDYYDGNQLDSKILRAMQEKGIPPSIENQICIAIRDICGYESKYKRDFRVVGNKSTGVDDIALAINEKLNQAERESHTDQACSKAYLSQVGVGVGWVEVSRESDPFRFPYRVQNIHRNEIWWDMKAKRADLSDARWLLRRRWTDKDVASMMFPKYKDLIDLSSDGWERGTYLWGLEDGGMSTDLAQSWDIERGWSVEESEWIDRANHRVCLFELYYRIWSKTLVMKLPGGRVMEFDKNNPLHQVAARSFSPFKAIISKIRKAYYLGPHCLADVACNLPRFPYVPFWGNIEDRTGVPYGLIRHMMYLQDEVNARISKMQWLLGSVVTKRSKGAVAMTDAQFRTMIARPDADIVLDPDVMERPNAVFEIDRNSDINQQQYNRLIDLRDSLKRVSGNSDAFAGRGGDGTASGTSQIIEQSVQSLGTMNDNYSFGRMGVGDLLIYLMLQDMTVQEDIVVPGNALRDEMIVSINKPTTDEETGVQYLDNDVSKIRFKVTLTDVPSTPTFRAQQLSAMEQVLKSLPASLQPIMMPAFMSLTDVPDKDELVQAIRQAIQQPDGEQIQKQIADAVAQAKIEWQHDLKTRELDLKESKQSAEVQKIFAEIEEIVAEKVNKKIESIFSATQAANQIAAVPQIAPIADKVLDSSGFEDADGPPVIPYPEQQAMAGQGPGQAQAMPEDQPKNTSPMFPARVQEPEPEQQQELPPQLPSNPDVGMDQGIEAGAVPQ